ncbi:MAG: hypothetical protein H6Q52_662 [Deltaproteobacteria bacterium]|nr:hypothetical protein [Deltaproteobacteria bacterium]
MSTAKLIIMLVLVLLVGIFAGSLGTRIYFRHELQKSQADRNNSEERIKRIVGRLTDELKLDDRQQTEVRKIITATDARATGIKVLYEPELRKIYDQSFERIGEKLTVEQKARLQKRQERFSAKYNAMYFKSLRTAQAGLPDIETISRQLGLDKSQQSQVSAILKDARAREDLIIEKYQKMAHPDLMVVNKEIIEARSASMKSLSGVLTKQQLESFKTDLAAY